MALLNEVRGLVPASELRTAFTPGQGGGGGYRKVDLPFLTLTQLWSSSEPPDPEEHTLQAVIGYLNQRWEEFTERDVGIYIDFGVYGGMATTSGMQSAEEDSSVFDVESAALWLVTSSSRTKMAMARPTRPRSNT